MKLNWNNWFCWPRKLLLLHYVDKPVTSFIWLEFRAGREEFSMFLEFKILLWERNSKTVAHKIVTMEVTKVCVDQKRDDRFRWWISVDLSLSATFKSMVMWYIFNIINVDYNFFNNFVDFQDKHMFVFEVYGSLTELQDWFYLCSCVHLGLAGNQRHTGSCTLLVHWYSCVRIGCCSKHIHQCL